MTVIQRLPRPRCVLFGLVLLAGLCAVGCTPDSVSITGYVHLNGQPVTAGTVVFTDQGSNSVYTAPIQSDGTYYLGSLPTADWYSVTLLNPQAPLTGVIPDRYATSATSGMLVNLYGSSGTVFYNIDLTN